MEPKIKNLPFFAKFSGLKSNSPLQGKVKLAADVL